VMER